MAGEYTEKLHLYKPIVADNVSLLTDFNNNWDELESRLGDLYGLTEAEINQLKNLGDVEISYAKWGYVGAMNQGVAITDTPSFAGVKIGQKPCQGDVQRSLANSSVYSFSVGTVGTILLMSRASTSDTAAGIVNWSAGSTVKLCGGADLEVATGVLEGTTGADGKVTVSIDSGTLYIENRLVTSFYFCFVILGMG